MNSRTSNDNFTLLSFTCCMITYRGANKEKCNKCEVAHHVQGDTAKPVVALKHNNLFRDSLSDRIDNFILLFSCVVYIVECNHAHASK